MITLTVVRETPDGRHLSMAHHLQVLPSCLGMVLSLRLHLLAHALQVAASSLKKRPGGVENKSDLVLAR